MKAKITLDARTPSYNKSAALTKIQQLGAKVTISGDAVIVDEGVDEKQVIEILKWEKSELRAL